MINWNVFFLNTSETEALYDLVEGGGVSRFKKEIKTPEAIAELRKFSTIPAREIKRRARMAMRYRGYIDKE
jgi:hypothetical protein